MNRKEVRADPTRNELFEHLRIPKGSEILAQRLRAAVLLGDLPEGALLPPEKELVTQLGVSRATVREGLRLLEADGLITTRRGRGGGAVIRRPSPSSHTRSLALLLQFDGTSLRELLEARRAIEPLCGRLAAIRIGPDGLAELRDTLTDLQRITADREAYLAAQVRFHFLIVQAAKNAVLRIYAASLAELTHAQFLRIPFTRDDFVAGAGACSSILAALEQGDPDGVERRIARHLEAIEHAIVRLAWPLDEPTTELTSLVRALRS